MSILISLRDKYTDSTPLKRVVSNPKGSTKQNKPNWGLTNVSPRQLQWTIKVRGGNKQK